MDWANFKAQYPNSLELYNYSDNAYWLRLTTQFSKEIWAVLNEYIKSIGGRANKNRATGGYFFSKKTVDSDAKHALLTVVGYLQDKPWNQVVIKETTESPVQVEGSVIIPRVGQQGSATMGGVVYPYEVTALQMNREHAVATLTFGKGQPNELSVTAELKWHIPSPGFETAQLSWST